MAALTTYAVDKMLDLTLRGTAYTPPTTVYLSLMTVPGAADGTGTEVTGGGYTRKAITFAAAASGAIASNASVTWTPLHTGSTQAVVGWTIWDAASSGNMLAFHTLPSTLTVTANRDVLFTSGSVTVTSNGAAMSDYLANKWLDHLLRNTAYTAPASRHVAEFTATPTRSTSGTEVSDGSYGRVTVTFAVAAAQAASSNADVLFNPLAGATQTLTGWAVMDAATVGNVLFFGAYGTSQVITGSDQYQHDTGTLTVGAL